MDQNVFNIIYRYVHELKTQDLKKELLTNIKKYFVFKMILDGCKYIKNEKELGNIQLLSCKYYKKLLEKKFIDL
jgi:hypothetical protein